MRSGGSCEHHRFGPVEHFEGELHLPSGGINLVVVGTALAGCGKVATDGISDASSPVPDGAATLLLHTGFSFALRK